MNNAEIAKVFSKLADLLEIKGENAFRIRAYRGAVRTIEQLTEPVSDLAQEGAAALTELPGIGKDLAAKICVLVETGSLPQLEELEEEIPTGVVEMLLLPGIGPKKVAVLFNELNVQSLDDLKEAAKQGQVAALKGFGKKTEESILAAVDQVAEASKLTLLAKAKSNADAVVAWLNESPSILKADVAGSCRRRKETVHDLDVLVASSDSKAAMERLASYDGVVEVLSSGDTKQRVRLQSGIELDMRVVAEESYGAALQYFTGSKEHNIVIRKRAVERGLKINEYGVYRDEEMIAGRTEEDVYKSVDLPWVPPELRENRGEIELAEANDLPTLLCLDDMQGDLHMHTTATDGKATIKEMAEAAKARGLKYIAITDHSKRVSMAHGLDEDRLREHWQNINKVRGEVSGIEILCGIECDILEDATLDLSDEVLAEADWVIAVLHYGLKQPQEQIHERLLNAIQSPHVDAIGHLSGRLIGRRQGADLNYDLICKAASDYGVMLELNANPRRLDIDDRQAAAAKDRKVPVVISTDAHSPTGLDNMKYGVYQARRGGLEAKDVANTHSFSEFSKMIR